MLQLILALIAPVFVFGESPFWKTKDKVYARIQNREIIVSVKSIEKAGAKFKNTLSMIGGGQASAPCDFIFKLCQDFAPIARASGYLDEVSWEESEKKLKARIKAYGYESPLSVILLSDKPEAGNPSLRYEVVKGPMTGMKGRFSFTLADTKKCDIGMDGEYGYDKFPVPQFFLRFGMEVMFQRMAGRMRRYAEEQYDQKP